MSADKFKKRLLSIVSGEYKPTPDEPKIWFESLKSNEALLHYLKNTDEEISKQVKLLNEIDNGDDYLCNDL